MVKKRGEHFGYGSRVTLTINQPIRSAAKKFQFPKFALDVHIHDKTDFFVKMLADGAVGVFTGQFGPEPFHPAILG